MSGVVGTSSHVFLSSQLPKVRGPYVVTLHPKTPLVF